MSETASSYVQWFTLLTEHDTPRPWQSDLADEASCHDRLIRIPTGLGKTEGVLAAWSFHLFKPEGGLWPRRLVWCLPMRVLVEQTALVDRHSSLADKPWIGTPEGLGTSGGGHEEVQGDAGSG